MFHDLPMFKLKLKQSNSMVRLLLLLQTLQLLVWIVGAVFPDWSRGLSWASYSLVSCAVLCIVPQVAPFLSVRCNGSGKKLGREEVVLAQREAVSSHRRELRPDAPCVEIKDMINDRLSISNPEAVTPFGSDYCDGVYVFLHRPQEEPPRTPGEQMSAKYFSGKKRNWEIRFQVKFKRDVAACDLRIATSPFERLALSSRQERLHRWALGMASPYLGSFYNSPGDDPASALEGEEVETPVTSVCICEVDQFIETATEEVPPTLLDPAFASFGRLKVSGPGAFRRALMARTFKAGETYTFAVYGMSRFFNLIQWQMLVPFCRPMSIDTLNGPSPLMLQAYVLHQDESETRHLDCRKGIIWSIASWPSLAPLPPEKMRRLEQLAIRHKELAYRPPEGKEFDKPCRPSSLKVEASKSSGRHRDIEGKHAIAGRTPCCWQGIHRLVKLTLSSKH
mmetsp:Transcript_109604/g.210801  ORF Transcript_109604/g.210801 Transcript_109604/m.210801 type:complete len:450 (+) Transcript_109604:107-1456(+)